MRELQTDGPYIAATRSLVGWKRIAAPDETQHLSVAAMVWFTLCMDAYELTRFRHLRGEATEQDVDRPRVAYAKATKQFQVFWDTKRPID